MIGLIKAFRSIDGLKTHILAALVVAIGIVEGLGFYDVPGVTVGDDWLMWIIGGTGAATLRDALRKIGINT